MTLKISRTHNIVTLWKNTEKPLKKNEKWGNHKSNPKKGAKTTFNFGNLKVYDVPC